MIDTSYKKKIWQAGELLVQQLYESHWYVCKDKNFTIRGGEVDLVMQNNLNLIFVEVKVVNYIDNLHDYITSHKLFALRRTIETYIWKYPTNKIVRVDVVFVKNNTIVEIFKNIEL